jgi:hypothetical protein
VKRIEFLSTNSGIGQGSGGGSGFETSLRGRYQVDRGVLLASLLGREGGAKGSPVTRELISRRKARLVYQAGSLLLESTWTKIESGEYAKNRLKGGARHSTNLTWELQTNPRSKKQKDTCARWTTPNQQTIMRTLNS